MPQPLLALRIFIASPGGLDGERQRFRDLVYKFNEDLAHRNGVTFVPVGWETHPGGMGRSQAQINEEVRTCDYLLLVLHNRWGFVPHRSRPDGSYDPNLPTSGTEEEYRVARECHADPDRPMRDIAIRFKQVDPVQMSDPGEQLQKVLNFRRELEEGKEVMFKEYDTLEKFSDDVRSLLSHWLATYDREISTVTPPEPATTAVFTSPDVGDRPDADDLVDKAQAALDQGDLLDAELLLADALVLGENARVFTAYAFLQVCKGHLGTALAFHEKALRLSEKNEDEVGMADSYLNLGGIYYTKGDLKEAESMLRTALELNERLGRLEGMANTYGNLGVIYFTKGELEQAESMQRKALEIEKRLDRLGGMADSYGNLGSIYYTKGDLKEAESMLRTALELNERLGRLEGMANAYGNLGGIYRAKGDLKEAESMLRTALELNERLGRLEGIANAYGNLGLIYRAKGELEAAELMQRKALELNERLGRLEGMANTYGNLSVLYEIMGDLEEARRFGEQAVELYARIPMPHRVDKWQGWLDGLEASGGEEEA